MSSANDSQASVMGLAITVAVHLLVAFVLIFQTKESASAAATKFEDAQIIEASLAFKKVTPKTRQPQKRKKKKFQAKEQRAASKDETKTPEPKKEKETLTPDLDELDPNSVLAKNRMQDDELSDTGSDEEVPVEGSDDGSKWGTASQAKGDPYVAELTGRVYSVWKVPTLETGTGLAIGCIRTDEDGQIVEREIKTRSKNANLDRSVEVALQEAPGMEKPVPEHLKTLLTVEGLCLPFSLE